LRRRLLGGARIATEERTPASEGEDADVALAVADEALTSSTNLGGDENDGRQRRGAGRGMVGNGSVEKADRVGRIRSSCLRPSWAAS
jgi:hypothetical protein